MPHIMNISDPHRMWIKLRTLYQSNSMNRRLSLKSQLYNLNMIEKLSIEEHLRHVNSLIGQLANRGITITDDELVDRVLTSLPTSWDMLREMIFGRERPPTSDELEGLLLLEDNVRNLHRECDD
jgi:hypothetical protein